MAVVHHVSTINHPYALIGAFVLAFIAIAVTVRPLKHPVLRDVVAGLCYFVAVGLVVWVLVPSRWFPLAVGVLVVVTCIAILVLRRHRGEPDGDDDEVTKPKKKGPTPKKDSNAAIRAKKSKQRDHNTNIGKQVNNNFPPPNGTTFVDSGNGITVLSQGSGGIRNIDIVQTHPDAKGAIVLNGEDGFVDQVGVSVPHDTTGILESGRRNRITRTDVEVRDPQHTPREGDPPVTEIEPTIAPTAELMEKLLQVPKDEATDQEPSD